MKIINPSEISSKILTMIDESDQFVILVSPYMKISKWYKFLNKVDELQSRNILIEIYVRDDVDNLATYRDLDQLALKYTKIPHLHSKLYLNERYGIVTSMNLLLSSEINSLEIGYVTETKTEYNELLGYFHRYIQISEPVHYIGEPIQYTGVPVHSNTLSGEPAADLKDVINGIKEDLISTGISSWPWFAKDRLHINTGRNNYKISIIDGNLRITACLRTRSRTQQNSIQRSSLIAKKVEDLTAMKVDIHPGSKNDILDLSARSQHTLKSSWTKGILKTEAAYILKSVRSFINATDDLIC